MKAFAIDKYKGELTAREVSEPRLGHSDVLVSIAATSINPLDLRLRDGDFAAILPNKMPLILGNDLAGRVLSVGAGVSRFKVGDEVFGRPAKDRIGTFAERIAVDEGDLALKPSTLDMTAAASLPLVALTAWQALVERANIQPGQKILVHAGSGGVGTIAIQLAKHLGASVATTTSAQNVELVRSLGADVIIDYRNENFEEVLSDYDVVLHSLGSDTLEKSLSVLKRGGKLISLTGPPDPSFAREIGANWVVKGLLGLMSGKIRRAAQRKGAQYSFLFMRADGQQLSQIAALVDAGAIKPVVDSVFAFDEIPAAMERSASGRARGKVVVQISSDTGADPKAVSPT